MRRLMTFGMGMVVGALLLYGALNYHVIQSKQGLHFIPKASASLSKSYVDIRQFTLADWARNTDIALALTNANQVELMENAAGNALQNGIDRLLLPSGER